MTDAIHPSYRYDSHMTHSVPLLLVVACALIDPDGRVMMTERPAGKEHGGLWEFPGGKVEAGERPEDALARELHEELGITAHPASFTPFSFASQPAGARHLLMPLFICRVWEGAPTSREGQRIRWFRPTELDSLPVPPADGPLIAALLATGSPLAAIRRDGIQRL
jgi:8-oxo-dGTP diphosphatase